MDDKYYILQDIVIDTFELDAPVEIEKGALWLDKLSRQVILQLKLIVLGANTSHLSSVTVNIDCLDDALEIITDVSPYTYTFRDVFLNKSNSFGDNVPIQLDQRVRRVKVGIQRVVFIDSSAWNSTRIGITLPKQFLITTLEPKLFEQFKREIRNLPRKDEFVYIPLQFNDYWLCTCGRPNKNDNEICTKCGLSKAFIFQVTEADFLENNLQKFNEEVRIAEEERLRAEEERVALAERRRQQLKVMIKPALAILLVITVIAFFLFWITPTERAAITSVISKIDLIGQIDKNSGQKIEEAEDAYFSLDEKLQKKVENKAILADARASYDGLFADDVIQAIRQIGEVTTKSETSINAVFDAYESLTDDQKELVSNFDVLKHARDSYNQLKANEVSELINSVGKVSSISGRSIYSAFEKYNLLTDEQKTLVSNFDFLENAKQTYNQLQANNVIEAINSIGVVTLQSKDRITIAQGRYDLLTPEQQKLVTNYDDIQFSRDEFSRLEVANVIDLIDAIGEVSLENTSLIEKAKASYDELTPSEQELVTNYTKLEKFVKDLSTAEVNNVISMIDAISAGTIENEPQIIEARASYEKLDSGQRQEVTNFDLLVSFEQAILEITVSEINRFIANLNLNYLRASDEEEVLRLNEVYKGLPTDAKSEVEEYSKLTQAIAIFKNYRLAKQLAVRGDYEEAYNLMLDLNYLDSKTLAREYEKIAFRWWVEGGMTQEVYTPYEEFEVEFTVHGGKPGESIDVLVICTTPDWSNSAVSEDLYDGWSDGWLFWNNQPQYASIGRATMTLKNYATGEFLKQYDFRIGY
jgi:hypothetical protein